MSIYRPKKCRLSLKTRCERLWAGYRLKITGIWERKYIKGFKIDIWENEDCLNPSPLMRAGGAGRFPRGAGAAPQLCWGAGGPSARKRPAPPARIRGDGFSFPQPIIRPSQI